MSCNPSQASLTFQPGARVSVSWNRLFTDIPENTGHHTQGIPADGFQDMFVRCMLRAAPIGMRHPDRREFEDIGETVVGERSGQIGKHMQIPSGFADRSSDELRPRVRGIKPSGAEKSTIMNFDFDLLEPMPVKVTAQRGHHLGRIGADDET